MSHHKSIPQLVLLIQRFYIQNHIYLYICAYFAQYNHPTGITYPNPIAMIFHHHFKITITAVPMIDI